MVSSEPLSCVFHNILTVLHAYSNLSRSLLPARRVGSKESSFSSVKSINLPLNPSFQSNSWMATCEAPCRQIFQHKFQQILEAFPLP